MEGSSAQMFVSSNEVTMHSKKASACIGRDSVGVWNSGLNYEPLADTCHSFWSNKGVNVPAHITTVDIVNGGVQAPQLSRTAKKAPAYTPNYLAFPSIMLQGSSFPKEGNQFPSIMLQGSSFPKEGNQLSAGPALNGVGETGLHKSMGHIFGSSQAQSNKVDVQLSEVCQRRFVMFDRCGSKRRMIFHPALMNEFPALLSSSLLPKTGACKLDPLPDKAFTHRDLAMVVSPFIASTDPVGPTFPNYNSHHLLLRKTYVDSHSSASDNCDNPILSSRENAEAKREQDGDGTSELSYFSHENTEDLEALLSSDEDEVSSTGHSPSDLTRNISPLNSYSNNEGHSVRAGKKRKNKTDNNMEDEDTCSTATSGIKMCKETPCQNVNATGTNATYGKESFVAPHKATLVKDLDHGNGDLTAFDMFFPDEVSSSSSANNGNKLPSMQQQQQPDGQSRKEKIKSILRLLRGIIPGGESMDTAFVLDEAIQYVKTLQFEVQKLQARKLI